MAERRASSGAFHTALQAAAKDNLAALLAGKPPVALPAAAMAGLLRDPGQPDPLQGFGVAVWRSAALPDSAFATRLMAEPGLATALASTSSEVGAAVLVPILLRGALSDGAFRHQIANLCRQFLAERVFFHPGPPPAPLFSAGGLAALITSQEAHGALLGTGFAPLRTAAEGLRGPDQPLGPWDQWLLRRMDEAQGWLLTDGMTDLPWVAWRAGSPLPAAPDDTPLPGYWPQILDLLP